MVDLGILKCQPPDRQRNLDVQFLFAHKVYDILIQFCEESLGLYPHHPFYCTYLAASYFYTNRYNRASKVLPHVDPMALAELCPEIVAHPQLGPLVPSTSPGMPDRMYEK